MKTAFKLRKTTFHLGDHVKTLKGCREKNHHFKGKILKFTYWKDYPSAIVKRDNRKANRELYQTESTTCLLKNLVII